MLQKIKDHYHNLRHHKIMAGLIIALTVISYQLFIRNYTIQSPIVSLRGETYQDVWNSRAVCLMDLATARTAEIATNQDILK